MCRTRSKRVTTLPVMRLAAVSWWQIGCVFTALVAGVFTQLPGSGTALSRAAFAAPAGGDAVTVWNANAGVAATAACIAPSRQPIPRIAHLRDDARRHP